MSYFNFEDADADHFEVSCDRCDEKDALLEDVSGFFQNILDMCYGIVDFDKTNFANDLEELCKFLRVEMPNQKLIIGEKENEG